MRLQEAVADPKRHALAPNVHVTEHALAAAPAAQNKLVGTVLELIEDVLFKGCI